MVLNADSPINLRYTDDPASKLQTPPTICLERPHSAVMSFNYWRRLTTSLEYCNHSNRNAALVLIFPLYNKKLPISSTTPFYFFKK